MISKKNFVWIGLGAAVTTAVVVPVSIIANKELSNKSHFFKLSWGEIIDVTEIEYMPSRPSLNSTVDITMKSGSKTGGISQQDYDKLVALLSVNSL